MLYSTRLLSTILVFMFSSNAVCTVLVNAEETAKWNDETNKNEALSSDQANAYLAGQTLWLEVNDAALTGKKVVIPRICAPIRSIQWMDQTESAIKFVPEPSEWVFSWKRAPNQPAVIEVQFDSPPIMPSDLESAEPAGDGSIMLHAFQASTFGEKLRFEPQWYKNTVGYWAVAKDYATWKLTIEEAGEFSVAVLQGCGAGQGGSDALITLRQGDKIAAELPFNTIDTGHFQNFRWNHLGAIRVDQAGKYELRIEPKRIAKGALFDVRAIHLVKQAKPKK